ncbi:hypothetical protein [Rhodohalobacter sp. 8-1]|uniref:hypothetical protein n=1 Tax=Rhodohalobacter sp. 8-1 TaxID=3131972 RepID=UPI0030EF68C8
MSKKRILEGIAIAIVAFLFTTIVNFSIDYLNRFKGEITKGAIVRIDNSNFYTLEIINNSDISLNGIRISVPEGFNTDQIKSNFALDFELEANEFSGNSKLIISGIEPESKYFALLPYYSNSSYYKVLNNQELGLVVKDFNSLRSPSLEIIKDVAIDALFYSIVVFVFFVFISREFDKRKVKMSESLKNLEKIQGESERIMQSVDKLSNRHRKIKTLLMARISDYSKELEFWRNTIKSLLISKYDKSEDSVDDLLREISRSLNTQRTLAFDKFDFDEIEVMLKLLKNDENGNDD